VLVVEWALVATGRRDSVAFKPIDDPLHVQVLRLSVLVLVYAGLLLLCLRFAHLAAVPPLVVAYTAFADVRRPVRLHWRFGVASFVAAAGLGSLVALAPPMMQVALLPIAVVLFAGLSYLAGYFLPPAAAALLLAPLVGQPSAYAWQVPLGAIVFLSAGRAISWFRWDPARNPQSGASRYRALSLREFTRAAERYDSTEPGVYVICRRDWEAVVSELENVRFESLLDAGCGTGAILKMISGRFPGCRLAGLDLTPKMIEHAVAKKIPGAEFTVGDCECMPYGDASFDVVVNSMSVHHYPDPQAFIREVARVLKPGGRLILRDVTMRLGALRWFVNHIEMPLLNRIGYGDVKMYSLDEMRRFCSEAGLEVETLECRWPIRLHLVAIRR